MSSAASNIDSPSDVRIEDKASTNNFKRNSVLIVDDELGIRSFLQKGLEKQFGLVEVAEDVEAAEEDPAAVARCDRSADDFRGGRTGFYGGDAAGCAENARGRAS